MSGSERGAARINVEDDDPGTAGDAGTASGAVVDFESAAPTRPKLEDQGKQRPRRGLRCDMRFAHGRVLGLSRALQALASRRLLAGSRA